LRAAIPKFLAMDLLTALGLASNTSQFVDFTISLISASYQLRVLSAGKKAGYIETGVLAQNL
jgi:hypothetical protein